MTDIKFKYFEQQVLRILQIKKGQKNVGNISYYRKTNSEINDIFDNNLLATLQVKYPESTLEIVKINTDASKELYENKIIRKLSLQTVSIHWIQEIGIPESSFYETGRDYPSKKTLFNINIATSDIDFLKDLENTYEVLIPASIENEKLMTTFLPIL